MSASNTQVGGKNIGHIRQVIGPTVDIEFPSDSLPNLMNAITILNKSNNTTLTVEVSTHIGDNVVRCVAMAQAWRESE